MIVQITVTLLTRTYPATSIGGIAWQSKDEQHA